MIDWFFQLQNEKIWENIYQFNIFIANFDKFKEFLLISQMYTIR